MTCAVESSAYRIHRPPPLGVCRRCHAMPCMHSTTVHNLPSRSYIRFDPPPCKKKYPLYQTRHHRLSKYPAVQSSESHLQPTDQKHYQINSTTTPTTTIGTQDDFNRCKPLPNLRRRPLPRRCLLGSFAALLHIRGRARNDQPAAR